MVRLSKTMLANGINDHGVIVGMRELDTPVDGVSVEAFIYTDQEGLIGLGTFGGEVSNVREINNAGVIVGWAWRPDGTTRAVRHAGKGPLNPLSVEEEGDDRWR